MIDLSLPQGRTLDRARKLFTEVAAVEALLRPSRPGRKRPAASTLYAASGDGDAEEELAENRHARRMRALVLAQSALFTFGTLRAASSGGLSERYGDGCHIRIERSRAEPDQFLIVVRVLRDAPTGRVPTALIVCDREDHCRRFPLPAMRNHIAQFIAESGSDLIRLMDDPTTRVFLG